MIRTPMLRTAGLLVLLAGILLSTRPDEERTLAARTVVLLRHAETAASTRTERDPGLSDAGHTRATSLAKLLGKAGVTHLFCSEFRRTRETLGPLAETSGLAVETVGAREEAALLARLDALPPGSVAVVAGHSNTVPSLAAALGVALDELEHHPTHGALLDHDSYDRLFAVVRPARDDARSSLLELRYGD